MNNKIHKFLNIFISRNDKEKNGIRSYLIRASTGSISIKIVAILLAFLINVVAARILGPTGFGDYSFIFAIISVLVIPTQLGLPKLIVREIAAYNERKSWNKLKGILIRSNQIVIVSGVIVLSICIILIHMLPDYFNSQNLRYTFYWSLPLLLIIPLTSLRSSALKGLKEVIFGILPEQIIKPIILLSLIGMIWFFMGDQWFSSYRFMMLVSTSFLIAFIIGAYWLKKKLPLQVIQIKPNYNTKSWLKSTLPFMLLGGLAVLNNKVDLILLGILGNSAQVGLYEIANKSASIVSISLMSINMVVAPLFSSLWIKKDLQNLQNILTRSTQLIFILALPVALGFIFFGEWLLVIFGEEFIKAKTALAILSCGYLFNGTLGSVGEILNMTGYEMYTALAIALSAIANAVLNIILIPMWGIEGAAVASLVSFVIWNTYLGIIVYKKLNLVPSPFYKI